MISKILNEAVERYRNHLPLFLLLATGYGFFAVLIAILAWNVFSLPTWINSLLTFICYVFVTLFSFALTVAAKKVYLHQPANFATVFKELFIRAPAAIKIYLQFMGLLFFAFLLFIIPAVFVMIFFVYAIHIRFLEDDPAINPFRMSRKITSGNLLVLVMVGLVVCLPLIGFALISSITGPLELIGNVTQQIVGALYGSFSTNVFVGTYFHLRNNRPISLDSPEAKAWLLGGWQPSWPATLGLGFGLLLLLVLVIIGSVLFFGEFPEMRVIFEKLRLALESSHV